MHEKCIDQLIKPFAMDPSLNYCQTIKIQFADQSHTITEKIRVVRENNGIAESNTQRVSSRE